MSKATMTVLRLGAFSNMRPIARLAEPAKRPLANVTDTGLYASRLAVIALSTPQHTHAAITNSAPISRPAPAMPVNTSPPAHTIEIPSQARRPICSRKKSLPTHAVAINSKFKSNDTVDAEARCNPVISKTGAMPPPTSTVKTRSVRCFRFVVRRCSRTRSGATAIAAPRYNSPARINGPASPTRSFVAGVAKPKQTAANPHNHQP